MSPVILLSARRPLPERARIQDTVELDLGGRMAGADVSPSIDDTVDLENAWADSSDLSRDAIAERYASGIIRCYRARTILERVGGDSDWAEAWSHLTPLEPHHVPPRARPTFFELTYLMHAQSKECRPEPLQFRDHVLKIAGIIDDFLDDLEC
jgi:hypothetical protein